GLDRHADASARQEHLRPALRRELLLDVEAPVDAVDAVRQVGGQFAGDVDEVLPGPGVVVGQLDAGLLEEVEVDQQTAGVAARRQAVDRAVERGRGVRRRVVVVKAHSVGDGGEVDQLTGRAVLGRVGATHGDHVGRVTGGGGGGELVEVAVEDGRLGDDRDPGVLLRSEERRV